MIHFKNLLTINLKEELKKNSGKVTSKTPREHQIKAHVKMNSFFLHDEKKKGILVLPTGGGKTYTATYWLMKNAISKKKKILWIADQSFLLDQARESFKENILEIDTQKREIINIRIVSGSDNHSNPNSIEVSDDILFITAQTAISNWDCKEETKFKKFINYNGANNELFVVYDEAHHTPAFGRRNLLIGGSETKKGILELFPSTCLLGLTATPTYTDKHQRGWLWEIFSDGIIYEVSKKELEDKKVLAHPIFIPEKTKFNFALSDSDIDKLILKHQEIPTHIIEELAKNEERNDFIAKYYCENSNEFGKTIIFLDRWYQCKTIENYINKKAGKVIAASVFSYIDSNHNIEYINNRTADQNEINLEKFKKGDLKVLINVRMLTEGVDVPDVRSVFITRDTNSQILFTQMIGRALRGEKAGGNKETANIVLFTDNWNRHIQFASARFIGGKEDIETKERGYRPLELIRIDVLDKLELEYQNQIYQTSFSEMLPLGWYVVRYADTIIEEIEEGQKQKSTENFIENVIVLENESFIFKSYISNYNQKYKSEIWEHEELDYNTAYNLITNFIKNNDSTFINNKATITKLIQLSRHLGQNNIEPEYYTFEQKNDIDLRKYVIYIRENRIDRDKTEEYLESEYYKSTNPFLKVIFPEYEDFYKAYEYEDNVYRKSKRGVVQIAEANQENKVKRLAEKDVREIVLSTDSHQCVCCGKGSNLQIDHIIAFKECEPKDDSPELYQTLCSTCNKEKNIYSYNYRTTFFEQSKMQLRAVLTSSRDENPIYFITRLINCYYATNAVHKNQVKAENHGSSIWKVKVKHDAKPQENILKMKKELIEIIKTKGYKLKDIEIESY